MDSSQTPSVSREPPRRLELGQEQQETGQVGVRDARGCVRGDLRTRAHTARLHPRSSTGGTSRTAMRTPFSPNWCSHRTEGVGQQPGLGRFRGTVSTGLDARMTAVPTDDLFDWCAVRVLVGDRGGVARPHRRGVPARRRGEGRRARRRDRAGGQGARQPPHGARPPRPRAPSTWCARRSTWSASVTISSRAWEVIAAGLAPHRPPSTLLGVSVLGYPDQLVEIDGIAARPESGGD